MAEITRNDYNNPFFQRPDMEEVSTFFSFSHGEYRRSIKCDYGYYSFHLILYFIKFYSTCVEGKVIKTSELNNCVIGCLILQINKMVC